MKIGTLHLEDDDNLKVASVEVESAQGNRTLWYSIDKSFSHLISKKSDAFLLGLLIPAMEAGEDIHIEGTVSEILLYNLSGPYQKILKTIIPFLHYVSIYPATVSSDRTDRPTGVATGFSGGIDSFCVLADHYHPQVSDPYQITYLLFNNVGSHGRHGEKLFHDRYKDLLPVTEALNLPFLMINSNLDSFYGRKSNFEQTHTPRNVSVALLLQGGINSYLYASAVSYEDAFIGKAERMGYSDCVSLPLLKTEIFEPFSSGSEYTRVEKTLKVAHLPESYNSLDICVRPRNDSGFRNCASCWKCLRTLSTLEIAGLLEKYNTVFDLSVYAKNRKKYFSILLGSRDPLHLEIKKFAEERNFSYPTASRVIHNVRYYPIKNFSIRVFNKIKNTPKSRK
jgi:hypothetical protein